MKREGGRKGRDLCANFSKRRRNVQFGTDGANDMVLLTNLISCLLFLYVCQWEWWMAEYISTNHTTTTATTQNLLTDWQ